MKELIFLFIHSNNGLKKLLITIIFLILSVFIIKIINSFLYKRISDVNKFYMARKRTYYIVSLIFFISIFFIWLEMAGSVSTYMGLLSAGIAISLKDILSNMAAWLFIILRKPFSVGDRILINDKRGDVIDVRIFQFSLLELSSPEDGEQSTGRIVEIPNNFVFIYPVTNYIKGFKYIWNEIKVEITFESDWKKAKVELEKILDKHTLHFTDEAEKQVQKAARKYMIFYKKFTPIVYTDIKASGVLLTLRYLCQPKEKRKTINNISEDILEMISLNKDIELAYPTRRVVD